MLNQVALIGRLTKDPKLNYTGQGKPVANFTLAVERSFKNRDGDKDVDFIEIVAWGKQAESAAKYLGKGRLTAVTGRLQIRKNTKGDRTYINPEVIASEIQFLDWQKNNSQGQASAYSQNSAPEYGANNYIDVPF